IDVDQFTYDNVYYHDYHGWRDTKPNTTEAFNAFVAQSNDLLMAVNFYTAANDVDYTVKIYDDFISGELQNELASKSGSIDYIGLHTIDLLQPVELDEGDDFYIYLELSDGGMPYDRTSDVPVLLGADYRTIVESTASEGESFYRDGGTWKDFYNYNDPSGFQNSGNFCMKGLTIVAYALEMGSIEILDPSGNNNGMIDPGETVDILISLENNGFYDATNVVGQFSSADPYITINSAAMGFGNIPPGESATGTINITVDPLTPSGHIIAGEITAQCNSGGSLMTYNFDLNLNVGLVVEDFETGDLSQFDWELSGNADWYVTDSEAYEGTYSVRSGEIGDQAQTSLSITLDVLADGEISFWRKVSSEATYDFLQFYIDNQLQDEWSGEVGWEQETFAVTQGQRTFEWVYVKDYAVANGQDCGWIDHIIFPPIEGPTPPVVQQTLTIPEGWSGMSSYLQPVNATVENIFLNVVDKVVIVQDMTNAYWPSAGMNTIGNWDVHSGYKIKVSEDVTLPFSGYDLVERTMELNEGWNLIPVICNGDVMCTDLFGGLDELTVAKEIAGTQVYWPGQEVMTLEYLYTGQSYLVHMDAPASITFPQPVKAPSKTQHNSMDAWDVCPPTGNSHLIAIPAEALATSGEPFEAGDVIGGFSMNNWICCGVTEITDLNDNYVLTVFGNDSTTLIQDGFMHEEFIELMVYRPSTDEQFPLYVQYDEAMPDENSYRDGGLSKLISVEIITSIGENTLQQVQVYPNPAKDKVSISGVQNWPVNVEITDIKGQVVMKSESMNNGTVSVNHLRKGIYMIRISNEDQQVIRKLVVK
ncbi:MAG: lectin like domain-containing protein, partial [Bacteroidota bacterium]